MSYRGFYFYVCALSLVQNITLELANSNDVSTVRLPLQEYMCRVPNARRYKLILTVNQGERQSSLIVS